MMPIVSKRRRVDEETGQVEEVWDYVFADDERDANPTSFKFLQMAHAWKAKKESGGGGGADVSAFVSSASASNAEGPSSSKSSHVTEKVAEANLSRGMDVDDDGNQNRQGSDVGSSDEEES